MDLISIILLLSSSRIKILPFFTHIYLICFLSSSCVLLNLILFFFVRLSLTKINLFLVFSLFSNSSIYSVPRSSIPHFNFDFFAFSKISSHLFRLVNLTIIPALFAFDNLCDTSISFSFKSTCSLLEICSAILFVFSFWVFHIFRALFFDHIVPGH